MGSAAGRRPDGGRTGRPDARRSGNGSPRHAALIGPAPARHCRQQGCRGVRADRAARGGDGADARAALFRGAVPAAAAAPADHDKLAAAPADHDKLAAAPFSLSPSPRPLPRRWRPATASRLRRSGPVPPRLDASPMGVLDAGVLSPSPFSAIFAALISRLLPPPPPAGASAARDGGPDLCA